MYRKWQTQERNIRGTWLTLRNVRARSVPRRSYSYGVFQVSKLKNSYKRKTNTLFFFLNTTQNKVFKAPYLARNAFADQGFSRARGTEQQQPLGRASGQEYEKIDKNVLRKYLDSGCIHSRKQMRRKKVIPTLNGKF